MAELLIAPIEQLHEEINQQIVKKHAVPVGYVPAHGIIEEFHDVVVRIREQAKCTPTVVGNLALGKGMYLYGTPHGRLGDSLDRVGKREHGRVKPQTAMGGQQSRANDVAKMRDSEIPPVKSFAHSCRESHVIKRVVFVEPYYFMLSGHFLKLITAHIHHRGQWTVPSLPPEHPYRTRIFKALHIAERQRLRHHVTVSLSQIVIKDSLFAHTAAIFDSRQRDESHSLYNTPLHTQYQLVWYIFTNESQYITLVYQNLFQRRVHIICIVSESVRNAVG